jgi:methylthioribose-1-phosphate isomerase
MPVATIEWKDGRVRMIDQTKLPCELVHLEYDDVEDVWHAIKRLSVRGAPAIGIAGALGVIVGVQSSGAKDFETFYAELEKVAGYLATSRPTAVNLFWALDRMKDTARANRTDDIPRLKQILLDEALAIIEEDREVCRRMGKNGAALLKDGDTVLTHCNAGALATADYGTALAVIYAAAEEGKSISVYADETRPLLQGARLTTWELQQSGIDVTLICDNTAAQVMKEGKIDIVVTGADRVAANGDAANKIGTYGVAVLAHVHGIPFYIAAPISTLDLSLQSGEAIPIELRGAEEVTCGFGKRTAPEGVKVYSPAFDVTPARYIRGIITENGIAGPPYEESLRALAVKSK